MELRKRERPFQSDIELLTPSPTNTTRQQYHTWNFSTIDSTLVLKDDSKGKTPFEYFGIEVDLPLPPVLYNHRGTGYLNANDPDYLDSLKAFLESVLKAQDFEQIAPGLTKTPFIRSDRSEKMTDVVTPNFKSRQGKEIVINPCSISKYSVSSSIVIDNEGYGVVVTVNPSYVGLSSCTISISYTVHIPVKCGFSLEALGLLEQNLPSVRSYSSKISAVHQDAFLKVEEGAFEALTFFAELPSTVRFLVEKLLAFRAALRDLKKGRLRQAAKRLNISFDPNDLAKFWLEARYAIRPLMIDIEKLALALERGPLLQHKSFKRRKADEEVNDISFGYTSFGNQFQFEGTSLHRYTLGAGFYARLSLNSHTLHNWGLTNIAMTAWEVIPFSFIVDWFVNISGFIASLNPNPIYQVEGGYTSVKLEDNVTGRLTMTSQGITESVIVTYSRTRYERVRKDEPAFFNLDLNLDIPKLVDLVSIFSRRK